MTWSASLARRAKQAAQRAGHPLEASKLSEDLSRQASFFSLKNCEGSYYPSRHRRTQASPVGPKARSQGPESQIRQSLSHSLALTFSLDLSQSVFQFRCRENLAGFLHHLLEAHDSLLI